MAKHVRSPTDERIEVGRGQSNEHAVAHGLRASAARLTGEEFNFTDRVAATRLTEAAQRSVRFDANGLHAPADDEVQRFRDVALLEQQIAAAKVLPGDGGLEIVEERLVERAEDRVQSAEQLASMRALADRAELRLRFNERIDGVAGHHPELACLGRANVNGPDAAGEYLELVEYLTGPDGSHERGSAVRIDLGGVQHAVVDDVQRVDAIVFGEQRFAGTERDELHRCGHGLRGLGAQCSKRGARAGYERRVGSTLALEQHVQDVEGLVGRPSRPGE